MKLIPTIRFAVRLLLPLMCVCIAAVDGEIVSNPTKKKGADPGLFRIKRDVSWGYIDRKGKVVIQPRFDYGRDFSNGMAAVLTSTRYGFINAQGAIVIKPQFHDAREFAEGLAPVRVGRKWGYVDQTGRMVIAPAFQAAASFHEGLARVYTWSKYACPNGDVSYTPDSAPEFTLILPEEDLQDSVPPCGPQDGRLGFIDKNGKFVIPPRFSQAEDFSEGLAVARSDSNRKFGYIDRSGTFAIPPRYYYAESFSEGLAGVETNIRIVGNKAFDIRNGFIDRTGKLVIADKYQLVRRFSEGLAAVSLVLGQWSYIDRGGRTVIAPRFDHALSFSNGLAPVCFKRGGCSYIDHSGKPVLTKFQAQWEFSDGLAIVNAGNRQVYIDTKGTIVAAY